MAESDSSLSANKQALLKIRELKQQLAQAQETGDYEPVAIVSMACRFPRHASSPERFWQSLMEQSDETGEVPGDRWDLDAFFDEDPEIPGRMYARRGVFLDQVDQMDPEFFGISPREATWVDPQQRLLMEVGWEALERAGWVPADIGEQTGVFVGWMHNDYQNEASDSFLNLNPYIATGAAGSFLCGRLAYYLGLQGPSLAVDTACSSSLVALHLAIQSLQRRDCDRALVGGVNVICSPTTNILTCKLKALSPKGHSRAFDAAADGYLRGEGCGVVAIRRLADAQRDGDPVLGVIRGSAVGHNGFSSGLTAPNPKAQEKVIRQALERAGVTPDEVAYLEAHGTGTELGDPIEMQAAAAALTGNRTSESPLLVGSVKTNIGHLEAAAGMAGLIKVLLSLQHNQIPGQLNFETPNPHIDWQAIPVKVLTEPVGWSGTDRVAGVSAFGMSGTNAHVVVGAAEVTATVSPQAAATQDGRTQQPPEQSYLLTVSGRTEEALQQQAEQIEHWLRHTAAASLSDVAWSLGCRRTHFDHRGAVVAGSIEDAIAGLTGIARGGASTSVATGHGRRAPRTAWQFTGQGAQYVGMARELYDTQPVFREAVDWCDAQLSSLRDESLTSVLFDHPERVNHTSWTQPALFAIQMGLAKLLQHCGLQPDVVLGHSVGQYAAACVAGVMSWEDGLKLIAERGRVIGELPSGGKMVAVFAPVDVVSTAIDGLPDVSLAASNGTHAVISGVAERVEAVAQTLTADGRRCVPLTTSHAFHSQLMDPVLEPFAAFASSMKFRPAKIPLICNMSGQVLPADSIPDGSYWAQHIRAAVRFSDSVQTVQQQGCDVLLELGPSGVLTRMAAADWQHDVGRLISCLQKDGQDQSHFLQAIGRLYACGHQPDFASVNPAGRHVVLPTYPFQRRRFWGPDKPRAAHAAFHTAHPLLGSEVRLAGAGQEKRFESFVEPDSPPWLPDHEVMGNVVMPGAAWVEIALAASAGAVVEDLVFEQPLRPAGRTALQTVLKPTEGDRTTLETWSSGTETGEWQRHVTGALGENAPEPEIIDAAALQESTRQAVDVGEFYAKLQDIGLSYGPAFQTVQSLATAENRILARLSTAGDVRGFQVPPPVLDGALHALAVGLLQEDDGNLFLPVGMKRVCLYQPVDGEVWCHAVWTQPEGRTRTADLTLFDDNNRVLLTIEELTVQHVSRDVLRQMSGVGAERLLHETQWRQFRLPAADPQPRRWLLVDGAATSPHAAGLLRVLQEAGHEVLCLTAQNDAQLSVTDGQGVLDVRQSAQWQQLFAQQDASMAQDTPGPPDATDETSTTAAWQPDGVVWLFDGDSHTEHSIFGAAEQNCGGLIALSQVLLERGQRSLRCGLQLVTQSAIATTAIEVCQPHQTKYWGLGRVVGAEQPEFRCRLIDLPADAQGDDIHCVCDVLMTETRENQLLIREGGFLVPRLRRVGGTTGRSSVPNVHVDGSYLITGGLGMLGRQAAKWLADHGAGQVVLVSRREPDEDTRAFLNVIRHAGCDVVVHAADLGSRENVQSLIAGFGSQWKPLKGVIHAAGVLDDALIGTQTWERFENVLAPKIVGASLLDELTRDQALDFFVLYSSAASVLGSPGQSNYATGNAFLDGLAWRRRHAGLPATSINWGPWSAGMADDERILKRMALQGIAPLEADEAHEVIGLMLSLQQTQATVMDVDWRRMRSGPGGDASTLLEELAPARQKSQAGDSELVARLRKLRGAARRQLLVDTVQASLQRILSTPEPPELDRPLIEMGLDSLMAVEFGTELQQMLGDQFAVGPTMLFDHPTIDAISDHVLSLITDDGESEAAAAVVTPNQPEEDGRRPKEPIAIIGLSCRFPGAQNADEFWDNLMNGVDSVRQIPEDRWDIDRFYREDRQPGFMYTREGGFLEDIADFDASFFNISDQEACWIDPQHRMLLENSYRALEDAGLATAPLTDSNVGVFMGIMGQDYAFLPTLDDRHVVEAFQGAGLSHSAGVGRISYVFGFEGPSIAVDTASSSSLVALHQAMRSLQDGHCNMALAGGVNAILAPVNSLLMSKAGLLSPDGRCKSFSAQADGFGRGEGCGVVVLKRLSDAVAAGDRVLAVVKGGAVVHNGTSSGITSPSGKSQSRVITEALRDAQVAPSQVQYLEAHGTGTEFGDPMELGAAAAVYGKGRKRDNPLLVGTVKANISHLEAAGGISGLIKTVLSIHRGVLPPQAHFEEPSPHIPWRRLPVKMVTEQTPWPEAEERLAGVTALGLVGTNAHVILGSPPVPTPAAENVMPLSTDSDQSSSDVWRLLTLSARSGAALRQLAAGYRDRLSGADDLSDVCFTASAGRRHFEHRLAICATTGSQAADRLTAWLEDDTVTSESVATGSNASGKVAWLFGDTHPGVEFGRDLFAAEPAFRDIIDDLDERLGEADDWKGASLRQWLMSEAADSPADEVAAYVLQAGLAQLYRGWGIEPDVVAGVGVGQFVASAVAGGVCFRDALLLVIRRQTCQLAHADGASDAEQAAVIADFETFADSFNYYPPNMPLLCSVSGDLVPVHRSLAGAYWKDHLSAAVAEQSLVERLIAQDITVLIEFCRNSPVGLTVAGQISHESFIHLHCAADSEAASSTTVKTLGRLYEYGLTIDFQALHRPWARRKVALPLYPFERKRYWITEVDRFVESVESVSS
ncbi:MAG: SDR family NAD(P)-dependent oxidoreductase [Planctomycetaceae bacterium]|nr:SDR family NAD(P)-dependent oxidoreductase [Planctomycetaceae bacterium]